VSPEANAADETRTKGMLVTEKTDNNEQRTATKQARGWTSGLFLHVE
jgi:hypothetical protein